MAHLEHKDLHVLFPFWHHIHRIVEGKFVVQSSNTVSTMLGSKSSPCVWKLPDCCLGLGCALAY